MRSSSTPRTWIHRFAHAVAAGSLVASAIVGPAQTTVLGPGVGGPGQLFCEIFDFLDCD